jgi:Spy/CpxP family protein refolding chaperone
MKWQIVRLAAVGSMAAGMIFAQAQPAPSGNLNKQGEGAHGQKAWRGQHAKARQRMMAALNLTPEQKTAAKTIFGQTREASKPVRAELQKNREAMALAVKADNKAQIERLSAERGRLDAKLTAGRGEAMAKFYGTLTPAQRAKAESMRERTMAHMRQLRNEHRGTRSNS